MMVAIVATQEMVSAMQAAMRKPPLGSDFDLAAKLDHAVGRQLEEFHRAFGVAQHPGEQFLTPDRHSRPRRREQSLAREKEAGVHHPALVPDILERRERRWDIDFLHEAITKEDPKEAGAVILGLEPLL